MRTFFIKIKDWCVRYKKLLKLVLTLLMLILVVKIILNQKEELSRLLEFKLWQIGVLLILMALSLILQSDRLRIIICTFGKVKIGFWNWFEIFIVGRFANTLFAQSGDIYRATMLKSNYQMSYTSYVNAYVFFTWIDSVLNFALALIVILAIDPMTAIGGVNGSVIIGSGVVCLIVGPCVAERVLRAIQPKSGILAKAQEKIHGMFAVMLQEGRNISLMSRVLILGIFLFGIGILLINMAFEGMGVHAKLSSIVLFLAIYKLSTYIIITPGNLGVRELAYGYLSQGVGIGIVQGVLLSAILNVIQYIIIFPLGLIFGGGQMLARSRREASPTPPSMG